MSINTLKTYIDPDEKSWSIFTRRTKILKIRATVDIDSIHNYKKRYVHIWHDVILPKRERAVCERVVGDTLKTFCMNKLYTATRYEDTLSPLQISRVFDICTDNISRYNV